MGFLDAMPDVVMVPDGEDAWSMIALRVEALAHESGWHGDDASPTDLFWLREHPVPEGMGGGGISVSHPDIPAEAKTVHPVPLLEMLERRMVKPWRNLVGFVVVVEAWMVVGETSDVADRRYAEALSAERRLREHPRRVEIRQAHLITLDRQERVVMRCRDAEPVVQSVGPGYTGAVPDAMRSLAATLRRRRYGRRG